MRPSGLSGEWPLPSVATNRNPTRSMPRNAVARRRRSGATAPREETRKRCAAAASSISGDDDDDVFVHARLRRRTHVLYRSIAGTACRGWMSRVRVHLAISQRSDAVRSPSPEGLACLLLTNSALRSRPVKSRSRWSLRRHHCHGPCGGCRSREFTTRCKERRHRGRETS